MPCLGRGCHGQGVQAGGAAVAGQGKAAPARAGSSKRVVLAHPRLASKRYCGIPAGTAPLPLWRTDLTQSHVPEMLCWNSFT